MQNFKFVVSFFEQNWAAIPSSGLRPSEDIVPQFLGMTTAFTDTSCPELLQSLIAVFHHDFIHIEDHPYIMSVKELGGWDQKNGNFC